MRENGPTRGLRSFSDLFFARSLVAGAASRGETVGQSRASHSARGKGVLSPGAMRFLDCRAGQLFEVTAICTCLR